MLVDRNAAMTATSEVTDGGAFCGAPSRSESQLHGGASTNARGDRDDPACADGWPTDFQFSLTARSINGMGTPAFFRFPSSPGLKIAPSNASGIAAC